MTPTPEQKMGGGALLPCPLCGGEAAEFNMEGDPHPSYRHEAGCWKCYLWVSAPSPEEAARKWNTRALHSSPAQTVVTERPGREWLLRVIEDLDMRQDCCGRDYLDAVLSAQERGPCKLCDGSGVDIFEGDAGTCPYCDGTCIEPLSAALTKGRQ